MGSVMAPRIVLLVADADDGARMPANVGGDAIHDGNPQPINVGGYPGREYRGTGLVLVVVKLAAATVATKRVVLVLAWLDADDRQDALGRIPAFLGRLGADVVAQWPCVLGADGAFESPSLEADVRTIAAAVRARWPDTWRRRLPTDDPGDPYAEPPRAPAPPTGMRIVGAVLA